MKLKRSLRILLVVSVALFLVFVVSVWIVGGKLVAPANRTVGPPPADFPFQTIAIPTQTDNTLAAWYVSKPEANATVVLFHPVRSDRRAMLGRARFLHEQGYAVLLVDLQAHGESQGDNVTIGYLEKLDVITAIEFVKQEQPDHQIGIIGWSLGGASTLLASPLDVDAIVIESVYPTVTDAVYDRVAIRIGSLKYLVAPALLCQLEPRLGISPTDLRPIDFVDKVDCPLLMFAGDADLHTPLDETERMFAEAVEPKQLVVFPKAEHEDLFEFDRKRYESAVGNFFDALSRQALNTGFP